MVQWMNMVCEIGAGEEEYRCRACPKEKADSTAVRNAVPRKSKMYSKMHYFQHSICIIVALLEEFIKYL